MSMVPIGVFDSGYGGLTVLSKIAGLMPQYDYVYLGDNARAPYGTRSFDVVYEYTLQSVKKLFSMGAPLVILACNTASAKALRTIQQVDLPQINPANRVLGVIRPSVEAVGNFSKTRKVGVFGTTGTVQSQSYPLELAKISPDIEVFQQDCPMWVPLVEYGEYASDGADYFVEQSVRALMSKCADIDTIILGCTHYPLLMPKIRRFLPQGVNLLAQGDIVASSLKSYLSRHSDIESRLTKGGTVRFLTTESIDKFSGAARIFFDGDLVVEHVDL